MKNCEIMMQTNITHNAYSKSPDFNIQNLLIVLHTRESIIDSIVLVMRILLIKK